MIAISVKVYRISEDKLISHFSTLADEDVPSGEVSLARSPDHCFYPLPDLHEHNGHAPVFSDEKDFLDYILRVKKDIDALLGSTITDEQVTAKLAENLASLTGTSTGSSNILYLRT